MDCSKSNFVSKNLPALTLTQFCLHHEMCIYTHPGVCMVVSVFFE